MAIVAVFLQTGLQGFYPLSLTHFKSGGKMPSGWAFFGMVNTSLMLQKRDMCLKHAARYLKSRDDEDERCFYRAGQYDQNLSP
jgi:hypothetical protein